MTILVNFTASPIVIKKASVTNLTVAPEGRTPKVVEKVGTSSLVDISTVSYTFTTKSKFQIVLTDGTDLTSFPGVVQGTYYIVEEIVANLMVRSDVVWVDNTGVDTLFYSSR